MKLAACRFRNAASRLVYVTLCGIFVLTGCSNHNRNNPFDPNGTNWSPWTACNNGLPPDVRPYAFAVSGTNLFAGTYGDGVFLSTNNGASWTAVNNGLTDLYVWALAVSGTNLFAGTYGSGVFLSTNNGTS